MRIGSRQRGMALVILLVILLVLTLVSVWMLSTSRGGILRAGSYRAAMAVQYGAEGALQQAVRRIQEITDPLVSDSLFTRGLYALPEKEIGFLVDKNSICIPTMNCTVVDPPCGATFDPSSGLNQVLLVGGQRSNVVCNFMGTSLKDTQVILVRKDDLVDSGESFAVFLVNAITLDKRGSRRFAQGVIMIPYEEDTGLFMLPAGKKAYLASVTQRVTN